MSQPVPSPEFSSTARARLQERYDQLWSANFGKLRAGHIEPDPILAAGLPDRRRGLTVIARPSPDVRRRVAAFLRQLQTLEPDQHYYAPSEFHVTVLSLFTATVESARFFARTEQYAAAVASAWRGTAPIRIEFTGVTASPGAILIQGFVEDQALNELRDSLRAQLRVRGLTEGLDGRYRIETAHLTVVRFRAPLRCRARLATALARARQLPFGVTCLRSVSLVKNDWYMTRRILETLKRYRLPTRAGRSAF